MPVSSPWRIEDVSDIVLLILRENASRGQSQLSGVTRLQKLTFLMTQDPRYADLVRRNRAPEVEFEAYKMGPFTPDIYEAIETLASFQPPLLVASREASGTDALETARFVEEVDLDGQEPRGRTQPRPTEYRLTPEGHRVAEALWQDAPVELQAILKDVLAKYGRLSLRDLLRQVYLGYPEMTVRSEIRSELGLP
jgi:uncharacterized phage-associated protein